MGRRKNGDFSLTRKQREAYYRWIGGMSMFAIAQELGIQPSAVYYRIARARYWLDAQRHTGRRTA